MTTQQSDKARYSKPENKPCHFTLDVLSDGSEGTGDGTLFLSVWKSSTNFSASSEASIELSLNNSRNNGNCFTEIAKNVIQGVPLARYAVAGLGDCTSRLAVDAKYKLHSVRSVFVATQKGIWGLPALTLALRQAGMPSLNVVAAQTDTIGEMIEGLEGHCKYPAISLCQVPSVKDNKNKNNTSWWQVYSDEYILVHGQRLNNNSEWDVAYLYTLLKQPHCPRLLLVPPSSSTQNVDCQTLLRHLVTSQPESTIAVKFDNNLNHTINASTLATKLTKNNSNSHCSIHWCICLDGKIVVDDLETRNLDVGEWWYTQPSDCQNSKNNLLIRAQQQAKAWHEQMPEYFTWNKKDIDYDNSKSENGCLKSYTSSLLNDSNVGSTECIQWCDRIDVNDDKFVLPASYLESWKSSDYRDDNEIDLDDDDDDNTSPSVVDHDSYPKLLIMGTGCASPSAFRGASAYSVLLDDENSLVFEVGEGFVMQWYRHCRHQTLLTTIKAIWVSHAHWDHYGGLPSLIHNILASKAHDSTSDKRHKTHHKRLLLMAPDKVLRFAALALGSELMSLVRCVAHDRQYNLTRDLRDTFNCQSTNKFSVLDWQNLRVAHSCYHAYGFIVVLQFDDNKGPMVLAFSGDTQPCQQFVTECCRICSRYGVSGPQTLIHEATYDCCDKKLSLIKKHSTIGDAVSIAKSVQAKTLVLTHFSQRYTSNFDQISTDSYADRHIFACDGLLLSLLV